MFYQCPLSGKLCFHPKNIMAYKPVNGEPIPIQICTICAQQTVPDSDQMWRQFVDTIFRLLHIDNVLNADEYQAAVISINNTQELNEFLANLAQRKHKTENLSSCPTCNTEFGDLLAGAKLGCPGCYHHFSDFVSAMTQRVQNGGTKHVGKRPKSTASLESLEKEMADAVKEERYEDAAKIRDKIKEMKAGSRPNPPAAPAE